MQRFEGGAICSHDAGTHRNLFLGCWKQVVTSLTQFVHTSKEICCWTTHPSLWHTADFLNYKDGKISMCFALLEQLYVNAVWISNTKHPKQKLLKRAVKCSWEAHAWFEFQILSSSHSKSSTPEFHVQELEDQPIHRARTGPPLCLSLLLLSWNYSCLI